MFLPWVEIEKPPAVSSKLMGVDDIDCRVIRIKPSMNGFHAIVLEDNAGPAFGVIVIVLGLTGTHLKVIECSTGSHIKVATPVSRCGCGARCL